MDKTEYAITELVTVKPGEPFRLLPFGRLVKGGRSWEITPEFARRFQLPHFKPPIKMGSHRDETPAGGHIVGLEVREDGLYALPEFNDEGLAALARGAYRYHSPEIAWAGWVEDPRTGVAQEGPLIVGDAFLHTPHLGEAAALYAAEITQNGEASMTTETVTVPVSAWERMVDRLLGRVPGEPEPPAPRAPEPQPVALSAGVDADQFAAVQAERDELAARVSAMETERQRAVRVERFSAELAETPLAEDAELPAVLADLPEETALELLRKFKALAEQVRLSALTADVGAEGQAVTGDPLTMLHAAIESEMSKGKVDYNTALGKVRAEQPDLIKQVYGR